MFGLHHGDGNNGESKLPGPQEIPELVGRCMIVDEKQDADRVWKLKAVVRKMGRQEFYGRVFYKDQVAQAGVNVKNWTSLDAHPELVLWEGYFNKEMKTWRREKFSEHSPTPVGTH